MALVGPSTFAPLGAVSKTQSAVSHSSTEAEVIALDYAIRTEGLPAMVFWDTVMTVFDNQASPGGTAMARRAPIRRPTNPQESNDVERRTKGVEPRT